MKITESVSSLALKLAKGGHSLEELVAIFKTYPKYSCPNLMRDLLKALRNEEASEVGVIFEKHPFFSPQLNKYLLWEKIRQVFFSMDSEHFYPAAEMTKLEISKIKNIDKFLDDLEKERIFNIRSLDPEDSIQQVLVFKYFYLWVRQILNWRSIDALRKTSRSYQKRDATGKVKTKYLPRNISGDKTIGEEKTLLDTLEDKDQTTEVTLDNIVQEEVSGIWQETCIYVVRDPEGKLRNCHTKSTKGIINGQQVLVEFYLHGKTAKEIAAKYQVTSECHVSNLIVKARELMVRIARDFVQKEDYRMEEIMEKKPITREIVREIVEEIRELLKA